jgi:predicted signal transduction protein with EAL and GGDEF domain
VRLVEGSQADGCLVARVGGDQFAILAPGIRDEKAAVDLAERLTGVMANPFDLDGVPVELTASAGIAMASEGDPDIDLLLRDAQVALRSVGGGRGVISVYDPTIDPFRPERLLLMGRLRRAISDNELVVHYQPKINLAAGGTIGVEALVRWQHPHYGLLAPDRFIGLAEQSGQIRGLTLWVLEAAARDLAALAASGRPLELCVNLSARSLLDEDLAEVIGPALAPAFEARGGVTFEVTESVILGDPVRADRTLRRLAGMGARIAIDDFGTGYSSLSHLRLLPVGELKIDKSFVLGAADDANDAAIVRSTIGLAHSLGLVATAEGVENERALELLRVAGCDMAQGFFMGRPMPVDHLHSWLQTSPWSRPS